MGVRTMTKVLPGMCVLLALAFALPQRPPILAQSIPGTIAYVRADTLDEIRLIEPDGSNDRHLWAHGKPDPHKVYQIMSLTWRPDAREIAFASTHEFDCSLNEADIFVVTADGSGDRRVTQAPSCAALASFPTGTVSVPVQNMSGDSLVGFLYFQGAPGVQPISLPPGGSGVATFDNVADFGDELQVPMFIVPLEGIRELDLGAAVDVRAGASVTTDTFYSSGVGLPEWGADWPTWRHDGAKLSYVFGFSSVYQIDPNPAPLAPGELLLPRDATPDFVNHLAWGPTSAQAQQLLYAGNEAFDSEAIYLVTAGSSDRGQRLVSYEVYEEIRGLAWLPDGTGFVYSVIETEFYAAKRANLFVYDFASRQMTRLTDFSDEYAGQLSVSPDGQQIVFERSTARDGSAPTDLWVVRRDGSNMRLLARNAARPSWSQRAPQSPLKVYIPLIQR
jgi:hypothetical protein